jgi:hypothetical protein
MGLMGGAIGFAAVALLVCSAVIAQRGAASPEQVPLPILWLGLLAYIPIWL